MATNLFDLGLNKGAKLTFTPTGATVVVIDDSKITSENGVGVYTLTGYCKQFMPDNLRNTSNSYQGPRFFTFNGVTIEQLASGKTQPEPTPEPEQEPAKAEPTKPQPQPQPETVQDSTQAADLIARALSMLQQPAQPATVDAETVRKIVAEELAKQPKNESYKEGIEIKTVNGESTKVDGHTHEIFESVLNCVANGLNVYLYGPAGCGKSHLAKQVAKALNLDYYETSTVLQEYKVTGYMDANGHYIETELHKAVINGGLFFFDELDCSCPESLTVLNGLLSEGAGGLYHCVDGNTYKIHDNFRVIAAGNTRMCGADSQYVASVQQSAAGVDRFVFLNMSYDNKLDMQAAGGDSDLVAFVHDLRKAFVNCGVDGVASYRGLKQAAIIAKVCNKKQALKSTFFKQYNSDTVARILTWCKFGNEWLQAAKECAK